MMAAGCPAAVFPGTREKLYESSQQAVGRREIGAWSEASVRAAGRAVCARRDDGYPQSGAVRRGRAALRGTPLDRSTDRAAVRAQGYGLAFGACGDRRMAARR